MKSEIAKVSSKVAWNTRPLMSHARRSMACTINLLVRGPTSLPTAIQYCSRTRWTNRLATMFNPKVITNNTRPTKKRLWKVRPSPTTLSVPRASEAMAAVIGRLPS